MSAVINGLAEQGWAAYPRGFVLAHGALLLDLIDRAVTTDGGNAPPIRLTALECALLAWLILADGVPIARAALLGRVWKLSFDPGTNIVEVHMFRLRAKLAGAARIETVRGEGYRLAECG